MSCEHATTTTLLWLYGEAEEAHVEHVADCAECQVVVAEHADVVSTVAPIAPALGRPEEAPRGARVIPLWSRFALPATGALGALAAAALLVVTLLPGEGTPPRDTAMAMAEVPSAEAVFADDLDGELDALDDELDALSLDLMNL